MINIVHSLVCYRFFCSSHGSLTRPSPGEYPQTRSILQRPGERCSSPRHRARRANGALDSSVYGGLASSFCSASCDCLCKAESLGDSLRACPPERRTPRRRRPVRDRRSPRPRRQMRATASMRATAHPGRRRRCGRQHTPASLRRRAMPASRPGTQQ